MQVSNGTVDPVDRDLIGHQGSRAQIATPALVLDLDAFHANLETMAAFAQASGIALRPHAKTHRCAAIARAQRDAGAVGICCAKLGEAEALLAADPGLGSVLLTSPVVGERTIERLVALAQTGAEVMLVVDHPRNVADLSMAARAADLNFDVLIDIDLGMMRTGIAEPTAVVVLAHEIAGMPGLRFAGLQAYAGHLQHLEDPAGRRALLSAAFDKVRTIRSLLEQEGLSPRLITGGGTGTHVMDVAEGVLNELQVGSYVFMDVEYDAVPLAEAGDPAPSYRASLFVQARVISANAGPLVTVDAGFKALATDGPKPVVISGASEGAVYVFMGDEHGAIIGEGAGRPELGDLVTLQVPHCDPTVNLYDRFHVVRGDQLVDTWAVTARGRSR